MSTVWDKTLCHDSTTVYLPVRTALQPIVLIPFIVIHYTSVAMAYMLFVPNANAVGPIYYNIHLVALMLVVGRGIWCFFEVELCLKYVE